MENPLLQDIHGRRWLKCIADSPGGNWFDDHRENLDRYYAQEAVKRLDRMVDCAAALMPVNLEIEDPIVVQLFQEAHDAFVCTGFDAPRYRALQKSGRGCSQGKPYTGSRQDLLN